MNAYLSIFSKQMCKDMYESKDYFTVTFFKHNSYFEKLYYTFMTFC